MILLHRLSSVSIALAAHAGRAVTFFPKADIVQLRRQVYLDTLVHTHKRVRPGLKLGLF